MKYNVILLEKISITNNVYLYKPMNIISGNYENIEGRTIFRTEDGNVYQTLENINNSTYSITFGVGYALSDEEIIKKFNKKTIKEAKKAYIKDFEKYLHLGFKEIGSNQLNFYDLYLEDFEIPFSYQEVLVYVIKTLESVLELNNIEIIKPILNILKEDIQSELFKMNIKKEEQNKTIYKENASNSSQLIKNETESVLTKEEKCIQEAKRLKEIIKAPLEKLDNLVGLENIKEQVKSLQALLLKDIKTQNLLKEKPRYFNMMFTGNPGTGKTTVAEILAEILCSLGYLKTNKVTKIGSQDLIGKYVGHTADKTDKLLKDARGGVVIIDEAYTLAAEGQSFRDDALGVLLKEMERPDTAFIFAGYEKEMEKLINANSGILSRIQYHMHFNDYTIDQLMTILENIIKDSNKSLDQEYTLRISEDAKNVIKQLIENEAKGENFGNARYINNLYTAIDNQLSKNTEECYDLERILTIMPEDVPEYTIYKKEKVKQIGFLKATK